MQDSASLGLLVVGKDAEISMLREQLAQLSSDLSRNLAVSAEHTFQSLTGAGAAATQANNEASDACLHFIQVLSAKEAEVEEAGNAVASLTAVLAEKDAVRMCLHNAHHPGAARPWSSACSGS